MSIINIPQTKFFRWLTPFGDTWPPTRSKDVGATTDRANHTLQNKATSTANLSVILMDKSLNLRLINVTQLIDHLPVSGNDARSKSIHRILMTNKQQTASNCDCHIFKQKWHVNLSLGVLQNFIVSCTCFYIHPFYGPLDFVRDYLDEAVPEPIWER